MNLKLAYESALKEKSWFKKKKATITLRGKYSIPLDDIISERWAITTIEGPNSRIAKAAKKIIKGLKECDAEFIDTEGNMGKKQ